MKRTLLVAALTFLSASTFASKARQTALSNSNTLLNGKDIQTIFDNPAFLNTIGDQITMEMGNPQGTSSTPAAEGGFTKTWENSKFGFYLGRQSSAFTSFVNTAGASGYMYGTGSITSATATGAQLINPMNLIYANKTNGVDWGVNLYYQKYNNNNANAYQSNVMGVVLGAGTEQWDLALTQGIAARVAAGAYATTAGTLISQTVEINATSSSMLKGGYYLGDIYTYGSYSFGGGTKTLGALGVNDITTSTINLSDLKVGAERKFTGEGHAFFYGIYYDLISTKGPGTGAETKISNSTLPFVAGIELDAASWLVLRGSFTQTLPILGTSKTSIAGSADQTADTASGNTINVGAGFKFGKATIDWVAAAGTTGTLSTAGFGTNASLNYLF